MPRLNKIWTELHTLKTDAQVLSYWEHGQFRILEHLKTANSDIEIATKIIHRLAKTLNNKEKYSSVYYLYIEAFQPLEKQFNPSEELNELKYELGKGLHHNRKYIHSKRLFNELSASGFDTSRIDGWWNQSAYASTRENIWVKTDLLPYLGSLAIIGAYIITALNTNDFLITTTIFILLFELYQTWWNQYRVTNYLKEFEHRLEVAQIKKRLNKMILLELGISLIFYPIYYLNPAWLLSLVITLAVYFQLFHFGLHYFYLPNLVGDLNRKTVS